MRQAVAPFEDSKPDWWILSRIAEKMGKGKPKYATLSAVQQEGKKQVKGVSDSRKKVEFERISYPAKGRAEAGVRPRLSGPEGRACPIPWDSAQRCG